jgi:hypothetical protein
LQRSVDRAHDAGSRRTLNHFRFHRGDDSDLRPVNSGCGTIPRAGRPIHRARKGDLTVYDHCFGGVWKAPAGLDASLAGTEPSVTLTDLEQGGLHALIASRCW